ncbi:MAG TPA: alpha-amylase, partial [Verrucomicrobiae bacterium]|nr:alpha-amylase [Verrucomicrobiae bacterium]
MQKIRGEDGYPAFTATIHFSEVEEGKQFRWGVILDGPGWANEWAITTEINDENSADRHREFTLLRSNPEQRFYLTYCQRLGAHKLYGSTGGSARIRFSVWAPHAQAVEVVFSNPAHAYIADDGTGIDPSLP